MKDKLFITVSVITSSALMLLCAYLIAARTVNQMHKQPSGYYKAGK